MIATLSGRLISKSPETAVVDVGGVGYEVSIPLSTYYRLPDKDGPVILKTSTFIKDDTIRIYGFFTQEEKELFLLLITVVGIGPRLARNILSGVTVERLASAIAGGDIAALTALPGVGKKTAERVVLELKDKTASRVRKEGGIGGDEAVPQVVGDVVSALKNMGYRASEAEAAARKARKECPPPAGLEDIIRRALRLL